MTMTTSRPKPDIARAEIAVARVAAAFPETREDNPWGHRAFKVRGKTFLFLVAEGEHLSVSVKLPVSGALALELPFAEPTGYGLGKSGWISARFPSGKPIPLDMIEEWLHESFAAIAPKKLSASLSPQAKKQGATTKAKVEAPARAKVKAPQAKVKAPARKTAAPAKSRARASRRRT
jgi:predicted DNA-binding protein (MmcQ/YjbR family)